MFELETTACELFNNVQLYILLLYNCVMMSYAITEHIHYWKNIDDIDVPRSQYNILQCPYSNKTLQTLLET